MPGWSRRSRAPAAYVIARFAWTYTYHADIDLDGDWDVSDGCTLAADGLRIDTIALVGAVYELRDRVEYQLNTLDQWKRLCALRTPVDEDHEYAAGGTTDEAFWRTMLADRFQLVGDARPATPQDVEQLHAYLGRSLSRLNKRVRDSVLGLDTAMTCHITAAINGRFFLMKSGYMGLLPKAARVW